MPSCFVKGCTTKWKNKDPTVTLHSFPWEPERIRVWLLQTGQYDANIDKMVQKILDGKVCDSYRMCSKHFEHHCYTYEEDRRRLRKDAIPTVFPPTSGLPLQQVSTLSTTQHITPVCTPTTTIVTFSSSSSGSHTLTTSALSLGSSISSVVSVISPVLPTSQQHSTKSSSDVVLSVPPNAVILPPTWPPLEIFPSSNSISQRKENLAPQKRDFSTNTMPFLFFPPKGPKADLRKKRRKRLCTSLLSFDGIPTDAAERLPSEVLPQMSSDLITIEIQNSDPEEPEPSDLSSNLEPFEMPSEMSTESTGSEVTTTSKWSKKRSTPFNLRATSPIEIPEFITEHNYYSNIIEQEDTGLSDMSPQPTEGIHPDLSDSVKPFSPIELRDQNEPTHMVWFLPKTGKQLANMAVPPIFPRNPKTAECSSLVTAPRLGERRRVTIPAGSRCPTCNQIVGPRQDFHPVTSEPRKEFAEKQSVSSIGIKEEQPSPISEDTTHPGNCRAESHRRRKKSVNTMDDRLGDLDIDFLSRMPTCVVNGCSSANRRSETLHAFPRDKERIRTWLRATGQYSDNLEEGVNKIFYSTKKSDSYWMCAKHFAPYCFIYNATTGKEILTKNAVPTIFLHQNATAFPPATKRKHSEMAAYTQGPDSEFSSVDESGETEDSQEEEDEEGEEVIFSKRNFGDHPPCYIHPVKQRKFIVFENSLDELILKIPCQSSECTSPIIRIIKKRTGSYISIFVECADHDYNLLWESQPTIDGKPLGNVILASAIFESGNSFPKMKQFFHLMNIMAMSENAYSKYQHNYIFPTIEHSWKSSQMESIENVQGPPVCISGDGRWDSLGNNDTFCVYGMMDMETKKILSFDVQQSAMDVSSPESEKIACKNALDFLLQNEISVKLLCTNRHFPIRKMVKEEYPTITHEFNLRQIAKSVGDKMLDASHEKDCEDLAEWVGAIQSHLRWCSDSYNGDDSLLVAKWNSILYHVQNVHAWEDKDGKYSSCQHKHLPEDTTRKRKWLKTNSPSFKALKKIVLDKRLRKDMKRICHFCHNGDIEVFLSAIVKYQSDQKEQQHVTIDEMYARTQLAALDHNTNCRKIRAMARRSSRTSAGSHRYNTADPKDRRERYGPEMYEPTNQDFLIDLMQEVVELVSGNRSFEWSSHTSSAPEHIIPDVKPDVKSIVLVT
ncbi:uncharacterized protein LOC130312393 [Hyla sarda]|uniref:uncharacterized protein LOC130312393 n=1 Tax=Hyla sarda TaxID=327740 RepID=UPI0024C3A0F4|nr:uncharacterized protein LOC130312393 [Hyla sarda]